MRARGSALLAAALACSSACAQIRTTIDVEIVPKPSAKPIVIGPPYGQVSARGVTTTWQQAGDKLAIELVETRLCSAVRHEPVIRIERITRKTGGALYWEYGIAAAALGFGLTALIKPELFAPKAVDSTGEPVEDLRPGYRIGGIFTGIGALALGAGIYDTVRARDEVRYADAYRVHVGEQTACGDPDVALGNHSVELIIGKWRSEEPTDAEGRVRFLLPPVEEIELPEASPTAEAPAAAPPDPTLLDPTLLDPTVEDPQPKREPETPSVAGRIAKGVLRIDETRALTVDFVVPYDATEATGHAGELVIEPVRLGPDPGTKAKGAPRGSK